MAKITVLGAGMVGSAMAKDLSFNHVVTSADLSEKNLSALYEFDIKTIKADLTKPEVIREVVHDSDVVLCAVPGFMGFKTVEAVIETGKNIVDISFFPEDCFMLDKKARSMGVTAIVDFGVAPGIPNLLLGYHNERMEINEYKCYVGGLPKARTLPFQYKAPFSPVDVIEEYTRPARYVKNGELVVMEALSEPEYLEFDEIGTLEAFNTDGLRSLLYNNNIPNKIEKTLRYPGHTDIIRILKSSGFFDEKEIIVGDKSIKPRDITSAILFDKWKLQPEEEEFTVMRIIFDGIEDGKHVEYTYNLLDRYDKAGKTSSMSRTTGYAATAAVNLLTEGMYNSPGINPPEFVGKNDESVKFVMNYMSARNIIYRKSLKTF
ncbi:MAG: saccharopine dehydrogenase C-terminal domain-containing protein [Candidatus Kapabacteria bacterium]|jgi:saccharopine dehydrogenase-like NADP-dependent oxidoreductase|nr:saccharopine dehydrogenase C-terminal domain-containing protein [Candidatus Kapabacteria bacterium]